MTAAVYVNILELFQGFAEVKYPYNNWIFQQDGASVQTAKTSMDFIEANFPDYVE